MSDWLIVLLGESPNAPARWAQVTDRRVVATGAVPAIADLAGIPAIGAQVAAVLRGEQAAMRVLASPPRNATKFQSAATFAIEDALAEPVTDLHVATTRRNESGIVLAVNRHIVADFLEAFRGAGIALSQFAVDFDCLAAASGSSVVCCSDQRVIASLGDRAFAAEAKLAELVIGGLAKEKPGRPAHHSVAALAANVGRDLTNRNGGGSVNALGVGAPSLRDIKPVSDANFVETIYDALEAGTTVNLLQGPYRVSGPSLDLKPWRRTGVLATASIVALFVLLIADGFNASRLAERYLAEARRIHAAAFPGAANVDPRVHARGVLANGGATGSAFLDVSDQVAQAAAATPGVYVDRIRYDGVRNQFSCSIRSSSDTKIEAFRGALGDRGLLASDSGGYRRAGDTWVGEMSVRIR